MKTTDCITRDVRAILADSSLTHEQQVFALAQYAEDLLPQPASEETENFNRFMEEGMLHDMGEGHAPYAPRYILPDYEKFLRNGSTFLRLDPPKTLYEALYSLLILYRNVPSVTHFPVYLGNLGTLLEPFTQGLSDEICKDLLRGFLIQLDRTMGDSFVHANIGPERTRVGSLILELLPQLQNAIPNMTLIYDPAITPDDFAVRAISASLECANPAFALDRAYRRDFGEIPYGIASCYNGLPIGGGAFTLQRFMLGAIAARAQNVDDFLQRVLPQVVHTMCVFMEGRIRFIVEETSFFRSNFLVREGLVQIDRFVGLAGLVGLADCVDILMEKEGKHLRFGPDGEANALGVRIMDTLSELVKSFKSAYSPAMGNHFLLHAQVGLANDPCAPGVRIPIGEELPLYDHLRQAGLYHKYFPTGVGDIFPFETTAKRNPEAILQIFKGAFSCGMRYISAYSADSDLVRVTGYLIKKSEVFAVKAGQQNSINDMSKIAYDTLTKNRILERKVRCVDASNGKSDY